MAVLLVDGCELAGMGQRLGCKAAKVAILTDLGVVDESLATDPLQQGLSLRGRRVTTESVADLHSCNYKQWCELCTIYLESQTLDPPPGLGLAGGMKCCRPAVFGQRHRAARAPDGR